MKVRIAQALTLARAHRGSINGFIQLSFIRGVQLGLGLVSTYFIAHSLSLEQYGEYQLLLNVLGVLTVFTLTEFGNTLMQSIARGFYGSYRKMFNLPLATSLIASVVLLGFAGWHYFRLDHGQLALCFVVAAILFPFMYGMILWRGYLIGEKDFTFYSRVEMAGMLLTQAGMIAAALLFPGKYIEIFVWFALAPVIVNLYMAWRLHRATAGRTDEEAGVISHGVKSSLYVSLSVFATYADRLLVFYFLGPVSMAIYTAADRIPDLLRAGVQDVATALAPKFATTESYSTRLDKFFKLFCLAVAACLIVFAFAILPFLLTAIYGEKYAEALPYAQALIFAVAIGNLASLQFRYIRSKLDTVNLRNIMVVTSLLRLALSGGMVPLFGLEGVVAANIVYRIGLTAMTNHIVNKHYGQQS